MDTLVKKRKPILIITFNRYLLFKKCFSYLRSNGFDDIWVTIDGPRRNNMNDLTNNNRIIEYCEKEKISKNKLNISTFNQGCRKAVFNGISWFFENNESGIIIEDDVEIEKGYLNFMSLLLDRHKNDKNIFSISSYVEESNFIKERYKLSKDIFLLSPVCRVWGWATWKNNWELHKKIIYRFSSSNPFKCFFLLPLKFRTASNAMLLSSCKKGKIDTWDYEYNFSHIITNKLSLTPSHNYTINRGFDKNATHTKNTSKVILEVVKNYNKFDLARKISYKNTSYYQDLNLLIIKNCGFSMSSFSSVELLKLTLKIIFDYLNIFLGSGKY